MSRFPSAISALAAQASNRSWSWLMWLTSASQEQQVPAPGLRSPARELESCGAQNFFMFVPFSIF